MATIATLAVKIIADAGTFIQTMTEAETKAKTWSDNVSRSMKEMGGNITDFGQNMTAKVTLPILAAGAASLKYASDLEETKNKVNVVFGSMSTDIMQWSQNADQALGLSQQKALDAVGIFGAMGQAAGMNSEANLKWSESLVQLSADWSSFYNLNPTDALNAIQSALAGQYEPLRRLGVVINQATVEAKAMQMGLVETSVDMTKLNGLMLDAEKAQAKYNQAVAWYGENSIQARDAGQALAEIQKRIEDTTAGTTGQISDAARYQALYALLVEKSSAAQGDFARTADGAANQARIVQAQFENAAATLGQQLLPYWTQFLGWVSQAITWFQQLTPEQQKWIVVILAVVAAVGPLLIVIGSLISAIGTIVGVIGAITAPVWIVIAVIAALIAVGYLLYQAWVNNWGGIQEKTQIAIDFVKGLIAAGMQFISDLTSGKLGWMSQLWNNTLGFIQGYIQNAVAFWKAIFAAFHAASEGDWYTFGAKIREAVNLMVTNILNLFKTAWENTKIIFSMMVTNIIAFFRDTDWGSVGGNIVQGIANGIRNSLDWIMDAAIEAAQAALDAAKGFLGIQSPSKVFEMQVGWQMAAGTALGWENGLDRLLPGTMGSLMPAPVSVSGGGVSMASNGRMGSIHVTVENRPLLSLGDRYEAEHVLKPMLQDLLRELGVETK